MTILLASAMLVAAGCGSKPSDTSDGIETTALAKQLRGMKQGEILIVGKRPVRFAGPYTFEPGGYVLRFSQTPARRLEVSLESERGSQAQPYQLLVDTTQPKGRVLIRISGKLFVHVKATSVSYVLRFTPARSTR